MTPGRRTMAAGLAALYLVACGGLPVPTAGKPTGVPFPCAGRACGCRTAEACWAGACCCFTAREKLAWANLRRFTPPPHFLAAVEREAADEAETADCPSCRAKLAARAAKSPGWLVGVFALKCKGEGFGGLLTLPPAVPAAAAVALDPPPAPAFARAPATAPTSRPAAPPVPPPRAV